MANLQDNAFLRIHQIVGDPTAEPPIPPLIPIGKSTWWAGVKSGKFPQPVKPISVKVVVAFVKNYADFLLVNLSGLRLTFGIQFQFRVSPLQRNGFTSFAI